MDEGIVTTKHLGAQAKTVMNSIMTLNSLKSSSITSLINRGRERSDQRTTIEFNSVSGITAAKCSHILIMKWGFKVNISSILSIHRMYVGKLFYYCYYY